MQPYYAGKQQNEFKHGLVTCKQQKIVFKISCIAYQYI